LTEKDRGSKVLVIGLDGASLDLIRPWAAEGNLPTLARLMKEGALGEMAVQLPPTSVPNWPSFATGKNPGKHGVMWWLQDSADVAGSSVVDRRSIKGRTIWDIAGDAGKRVAVINVPVTYPPSPVNGVMVTGLLTPPSATDYTYPPELKAELDAAVGGYSVYHTAVHRSGAEEEFLSDLMDVMDRRVRASLHLLNTRSWDLFFVVLSATDIVMHKFWKDLDPEHPLHVQRDAARLRDAIQSVYQAADRAVADLIDAAGQGAHVVIMSDHGAGGFYGAFFANRWLMDQGLLKIKKEPGAQIRHLLYRMGLTINNVYPLANTLLTRLGGARLRRRLSPRSQGGAALTRFFLSQQDIDWSQTRAFAAGDFGQIYINVRGRQPHGIVEPGEEYQAVRDEIIRRLETVTVPATGLPYLGRAYKQEELFHGPELSRMPDIICAPHDGRYVDMGLGFLSNKWFDKVSVVSGTHRPEAVLLLSGPDVQPGVSVEGANILDLAPTILYLLGVPVPDDMDGQVLTRALKEERLRSQPVAWQPATSTDPIPDDLDFEAEDAEIKDRLRALGYLS
jgi:predicted AlkP superfamily phosphohydrolase/phosphomutase